VISLAFVVGAWGVCLPLGHQLSQAHGLFGLWIGLVAGYAVVTLIAWLGVWATDWEDVARVARRRAEVAAAAGDDDTDDGTGTESDWGHRSPRESLAGWPDAAAGAAAAASEVSTGLDGKEWRRALRQIRATSPEARVHRRPRPPPGAAPAPAPAPGK
jgi:hypothetical protein